MFVPKSLSFWEILFMTSDSDWRLQSNDMVTRLANRSEDTVSWENFHQGTVGPIDTHSLGSDINLGKD